MPVKPDSAGSAKKWFSGSSTSTSLSHSRHVNPQAENVVTIVGVELVAGNNQAASTCVVTCGGQPMDPLDDPIFWDSNHGYLRGFILEDAPTGEQDIVASLASLGTEFGQRSLLVVSDTYVNVQTVGEPAASTPGTTLVNTVSVDSVLPAHRTVFLHGTGAGHGLKDYTQTARAVASQFNGGHLILGTAPGAPTVVSTATHTSGSTAQWGAFGVSLAPTPVVAGASLQVAVIPSAGGSIYRANAPAMDRYWMIPPRGQDNSSMIAGDFVRSSDGVLMPIWTKDPNDVEDYTLDFSNILPENDRILRVEFITTSSALAVVSKNVGDSPVTGRPDSIATVWFSGGVTFVNYGVLVRITTQEGRQHDRTFRIVGGPN